MIASEARLGAIAAVVGAVVLVASTALHPLDADPNDAVAAFAEYAASSLWIASHLGQFLGVCAIAVALIALSDTIRESQARAWTGLGRAGATASVALGAALQAVDGVALKAMVDRWAAASPADRQLVFEAAYAVRQVEIGLASLASLLFGLTIVAHGIALLYSKRYPAALGWIGILAGLGSVLAGVAQAYTGFSGLAMAISMPASLLLLVWLVGVSACMWRRPPLAGTEPHGRTSNL